MCAHVHTRDSQGRVSLDQKNYLCVGWHEAAIPLATASMELSHIRAFTQGNRASVNLSFIYIPRLWN